MIASVSFAQLKISSDHRYLTEQDDTPVFLVAEGIWDINNITLTRARMVFDSMSTHHFTMGIIRMMSPAAFGGPANAYGVTPWQGPQTFASNPNDAFWLHLDTLASEAALRGIYLQLFPAYLGGDATQGWQIEVGNSTAAQMKTFGRYIGNLFKDNPNIIWGIAGDYPPTAYQTKLDSLVAGIKASGDTHLMSTRDEQGTTTDTYWRGRTWVDIGGTYPYWNSYSAELIYRDGYDFYNRIPLKPAGGQEFWYEHEHNTTTQHQLIQQTYYPILSGLLAYVAFGNCPVWNFGHSSYGFPECGAVTWYNDLNSQGHKNVKYYAELFAPRHWWLLVPDTLQTCADSGYGTFGNQTYCTTAFASDSSFLVTYMPTRHDIKIRLSYIKGDSVTCAWYNPTTGVTTAIGTRPATRTTFSAPSADVVFIAEMLHSPTEVVPSKERPARTDLIQNYPNPFNPETTIRYEVSAASQVSVIVYNVMGQRIRTLTNVPQMPGSYSVIWDGRNDLGETVVSGVYLCQLVAGRNTRETKILLIR